MFLKYIYRIPSDHEARSRWIHAITIGNDGVTPVFSSKIPLLCSKHFAATDFYSMDLFKIKKLKQSAVPSIFGAVHVASTPQLSLHALQISEMDAPPLVSHFIHNSDLYMLGSTVAASHWTFHDHALLKCACSWLAWFEMHCSSLFCCFQYCYFAYLLYFSSHYFLKQVHQ